MDRWLGEPLPHQLSNPTRAHPCAINLWYQKHAIPIRYAVLAFVSKRYPPHKGRLLTRYSPVRHWSEDRSPRHRSTWMCYARRQRSSWARIKLSKILYHFTLRCNNLSSSFCSSFYFVWVFYSWIVRVLLRTFVFALYLSLVVQFSMTVGSLSVPSCPRSRGDSIIISHYLAFVNTFLKLFSKTFLSPLLSFSLAPLGATARIFYHFLLRLSRGFCNFFVFYLILPWITYVYTCK